MNQRVFSALDFVVIALWWAASAAAALVIADAQADLVLRIGAAVALWAVSLGLPLLILRKLRGVDEMQQMIAWRALAGAGVFIISYLVAMASYTLIIGNEATRGLMVLAAMAAPMAMMFAAFMTAFAEHASEQQDEPANNT